MKYLFTPMKINNCLISNRMVVPAMVTNFCNEDGTATEKYIMYHEEKAKGGWGLIITENYRVSEHSGGYQYIPGLWKDEQIESHKELTERVHKYDSKIFCQIYHAGRQSNEKVNGGVQPVAPSTIPCPLMQVIPKELTKEEIKGIIKDFGSAALRAKKCGFDGIEIHGGHGYLISEFLSSYSNKRTDEYGGILYNRMRFVREVYHEVRSKVGDDYPITIRFSADEFVPGGNTIAEARVIALELSKLGFDGFNVSASVYFDYPTAISAPMSVPHAWLSEFAREIKELVEVPVGTVNRINDPLISESLLIANKADFVIMGRASIADPYFPIKVKNNQIEDIRTCIGCLQGCTGGIHDGGEMRCLVNPEIGYEYKKGLTKAPDKKNIVIAGGGIAGMVSALTLNERGHDVTLYEKTNEFGGQFISAAYPPTKGELITYIGWLKRKIKNSSVKVHLGVELNKEILIDEKPDYVIVATGGKPIIPNIKGINNENVHTAEDVLLGKVSCGKKVLVAGGGEVGAETASLLGMIKKEVTLVEMTGEIAIEMHGRIRVVLLDLLKEYNVNIRTKTKLIEIMDNKAIVESNGIQQEIEIDDVVLGLGYKPLNTLYNDLTQDYEDRVFVISGANKTANALKASREGFDIGVML